MSIQLALLKSGEEVIADIKEFRDSESQLVSYFFGNPYAIRIQKSEAKYLAEEDNKVNQQVIYYKWMSLSKDEDIIVDKDWIVCITNPIDSIKKSYEEKMNGRTRDQSTDGSVDGYDSRGGTDSGDGGTSDSGAILNE
tara:strand:+ start:129 stop:542 length:414 start_codon:yes stop_codon:yes gene_type:complete